LFGKSSKEIPSEKQRLLYIGKILRDDQTLGSYGIESGHVVHMIERITDGTKF
jgi:ubiquilin